MDKEITQTKTIRATKDCIVKIEAADVTAYVDMINHTCTFFPNPDETYPCEECK